jgi:hypothetical protein
MKMNILHLALLLSLAILIDTPLSAGQKTKSKSFSGSSGEQVSFNALNLKGSLKKPDLTYIYKRRGVRAEQIVNVPENFDDEIVQGAGQF